MPEPILCPECVQGKCVNCTGNVLVYGGEGVREDTLEPCPPRSEGPPMSEPTNTVSVTEFTYESDNTRVTARSMGWDEPEGQATWRITCVIGEPLARLIEEAGFHRIADASVSWFCYDELPHDMAGALLHAVTDARKMVAESLAPVAAALTVQWDAENHRAQARLDARRQAAGTAP